MRAHKSHKITLVELLYYSKSSCEYMRQDILFIGMRVLVGKGKRGIQEGVAKGVDHAQTPLWLGLLEGRTTFLNLDALS